MKFCVSQEQIRRGVALAEEAQQMSQADCLVLVEVRDQLSAIYTSREVI